jgi:hypothetical protein
MTAFVKQRNDKRLHRLSFFVRISSKVKPTLKLKKKHNKLSFRRTAKMSKTSKGGDESVESFVNDDSENVYAFWSEIIASVVFFFVFVGIFYFTIACKIEGTVITKNINLIVDDFTQNLTAVVPSGDKLQFNTAVSQSLVIDPATLANLEQQDTAVATANTALLKKAIEYIVGVSILGLIMITALYFFARSKGKPFNVKKILIHTSIVTVFVALTEFCFLSLVGSNFITADANYVKHSVVESVIQFGAS